MTTYKQRMRELRKERHLTQEDIGKLLNTSKQYYNKYENTDIPLPIMHLITLAKFYGVSADYILGLKDTRE